MKLFLAVQLIALAFADYKVTLELDEINISDGKLASGELCDGSTGVFSCIPLVSNRLTCGACDPYVEICVEKEPSTDPMKCGGKTFNLGMLGYNTDDVKFAAKTAYGDFNNAQDIYFSGNLETVNVKIFIYDLDDKDSKQEVFFLQQQFEPSDFVQGGKAVTKPVNINTPRPKAGAVITNFKVNVACTAGNLDNSAPYCQGEYKGTLPPDGKTKAPLPVCKDNPLLSTYCPMFKTNNFCTIAVDFMDKECPVTCGFTDTCKPAVPATTASSL